MEALGSEQHRKGMDCGANGKFSSAWTSKGGLLEEEIPFELGFEGMGRVWTGCKVGLFMHYSYFLWLVKEQNGEDFKTTKMTLVSVDPEDWK